MAPGEEGLHHGQRSRRMDAGVGAKHPPRVNRPSPMQHSRYRRIAPRSPLESPWRRRLLLWRFPCPRLPHTSRQRSMRTATNYSCSAGLVPPQLPEVRQLKSPFPRPKSCAPPHRLDENAAHFAKVLFRRKGALPCRRASSDFLRYGRSGALARPTDPVGEPGCKRSGTHPEVTHQARPFLHRPRLLACQATRPIAAVGSHVPTLHQGAEAEGARHDGRRLLRVCTLLPTCSVTTGRPWIRPAGTAGLWPCLDSAAPNARIPVQEKLHRGRHRTDRFMRDEEVVDAHREMYRPRERAGFRRDVDELLLRKIENCRLYCVGFHVAPSLLSHCSAPLGPADRPCTRMWGGGPQ